MLTIAVSPCPNDVFNFYGLLTKKIFFEEDYQIEIKPLHDLNKAFQDGTFDLIKSSFVTYLKGREFYRLCPLGHSFSREKGPIILAREPYKKEELSHLTLAVAGKDTTGYLLSQILLKVKNTKFVPFDKIIPSLQNKEVDAGLVIHESRTKASHHGLFEICDLTKLWFRKYGLLTPLGAFSVKKNFDEKVYGAFLKSFEESIKYAKQNRLEALKFASHYSQEKDLTCLEEHVKNFSLNQSLFSESLMQKSVDKLYELGQKFIA